MEAFDKDRTCPKCGTGNAAFQHHEKGKRKHGPLGVDMGVCLTENEHMHRTCGACKHEWAEAPLS